MLSFDLTFTMYRYIFLSSAYCETVHLIWDSFMLATFPAYSIILLFSVLDQQQRQSIFCKFDVHLSQSTLFTIVENLHFSYNVELFNGKVKSIKSISKYSILLHWYRIIIIPVLSVFCHDYSCGCVMPYVFDSIILSIKWHSSAFFKFIKFSK